MLPNIRRAALSIAYDNGAVNRDCPETEVLANVERYLATQPPELLRAVDTFLETLTDDQIEVVCNGEETASREIWADAPQGTDGLLTGIFENM